MKNPDKEAYEKAREEARGLDAQEVLSHILKTWTAAREDTTNGDVKMQMRIQVYGYISTLKEKDPEAESKIRAAAGLDEAKCMLAANDRFCAYIHSSKNEQ